VPNKTPLPQTARPAPQPAPVVARPLAKPAGSQQAHATPVYLRGTTPPEPPLPPRERLINRLLEYLKYLPSGVKPLHEREFVFGVLENNRRFGSFNPNGTLIIWPEYIVFIAKGKTFFSSGFIKKAVLSEITAGVSDFAEARKSSQKDVQKFINSLDNPYSFIIPMRQVISVQKFKAGIKVKVAEANNSMIEYYLCYPDGIWVWVWQKQVIECIEKARDLAVRTGQT
jgi:hypothetical protein